MCHLKYIHLKLIICVMTHWEVVESLWNNYSKVSVTEYGKCNLNLHCQLYFLYKRHKKIHKNSKTIKFQKQASKLCYMWCISGCGSMPLLPSLLDGHALLLLQWEAFLDPASQEGFYRPIKFLALPLTPSHWALMLLPVSCRYKQR